MSVDDIGVWESRAGPVPAHGVVPSGARVAGDGRVHARDVHGGTRAGLAPGWASRLEGAYPPTFDPPDVSGRNHVEVVEGLLALAD